MTTPIQKDATVMAVSAEVFQRKPLAEQKLDTVVRHIIGALRAVDELRDELRKRKT
jgi:hypothetical protein